MKIRRSPLKPQIWQASVNASDNRAEIRWGVVDGNLQSVTRTAPSGKQGRSQFEQIVSEVKSMAKKKQMRDGYVVMVG